MKKILLVVCFLAFLTSNINSQDYYWEELKLDKYPSARNSFGMSKIGDDKVIIFGGEKFQYFNDTWIFDLSDKKWTEIKTKNKPEPRDKHKLLSLSTNKVLLFGGYGITTWLNDSWIFDLDSLEWYQIFPKKSPPRKDSYAGSQLAENKAIIFGGNSFTDSTTRFWDNDSWIFNFESNTWEGIPWTFYHLPGNRAGGLMAQLSDNKVLMSCGWAGKILNDNWIYDSYAKKGEQWYKIEVSPNITPVYNSSMTNLDDNNILLFGGTIFTNTYDDNTWLFNYDELSWNNLDLDINPHGRRFHELTKIKDGLVLLFGSLKDTWLFHYPTTEIKDNFNNQQFSISNSNDNLIIQFNNAILTNTQFNIYNLNGTELLSQNIPSGSEQHKIDISNLSSGVYFLRVYSGQDVFVKKFVKY